MHRSKKYTKEYWRAFRKHEESWITAKETRTSQNTTHEREQGMRTGYANKVCEQGMRTIHLGPSPDQNKKKRKFCIPPEQKSADLSRASSVLDYVVPSSFQQAQQTQQILEPRGLEYSSIRASKLRSFFFRARTRLPHVATASPQFAQPSDLGNHEISWNTPETHENLWKSMKSMKTNENTWKSIKIYENRW